MRIWGEALLTQVIVQTKIIPDASGLHQLSLKIPIFVLLRFSLPLVHNRKILLNFMKNLIPDRGPSVEYSARYFNFVFLRFKNYLFMVAPTFLKRTIISYQLLSQSTHFRLPRSALFFHNDLLKLSFLAHFFSTVC